MTTLSQADVALLARRIRVARGLEPGDLVLTGGQVVNVFNGQTCSADVVIADGWIAGVGPYQWQAAQTLAIDGRFVLPGLIDGHMHLESTLLAPAEFARVVVPHGTTAVVADPHEVGNVLGLEGIRALVRASLGLPIDFHFMAPSCVPATSSEHASATLDAAAIAELLAEEHVLGLAEMMDFPAVLASDTSVLAKIVAATRIGRPVDGHAPALAAHELMSYRAAGIDSDHESTTCEEALAKAALGMLVHVREGSGARNLDALLPLLVEDRLHDWCLCTDDVDPRDLVSAGHIDGLLRRVIAAGVPPARAIRHASLIPARHYGLHGIGAVAPSYRANLVVVDDLASLGVRLVFKNGLLVARDGSYLGPAPGATLPRANTIHLPQFSEEAFRLRLCQGECSVIGIERDQIITRHQRHTVSRENDCWRYDSSQDIALVASIERHRASGHVGLGLVHGFGLRSAGALASSVAHDSHNVIVLGTNPTDMLAAVRELERLGGGFAVAADGRVLASLPLEFAGLLSTAGATETCAQLEAVQQAASSLGTPLSYPFATLSFLALPVIPQLRITDQGLFDVVAQKFIRP